MPHHPSALRSWLAAGPAVVATAAVALAGAPSAPASAAPAGGTSHPARSGSPRAGACRLGHGVKHVVSLVFDNVHFSRDNPDVPSDLEQMPHLMRFLQRNGTVFSQTHTPLIAHTADDSLTIYTGLYGDRHGQPLSNSYRTYNPDGSTDPATSFAYWTGSVADTAATPTAGHDTTPTMAYSATVPARRPARRVTPAPWVPFTRAGCTVGDFSTANMVLENARADLPTVFGAGSPEVAQYTADPDPYKDDEVTDYVGVAVHCARRDDTCATARGTKFGEGSPSPTAAPDRLPAEPGGYRGYQALFGARYADPQLGAGTPDLFQHGYRVTDGHGTLVDLDGQPITNAYTGRPGFPGFDPTATQTLAYLSDMQESGIPVTYGYISDLHEVKPGDTGCTTASATGPGQAIGPGDACYAQNARAYDAAFATFFARLRADGITPRNTLFSISAEENDQFAGANVGRATAPTPAGCTGGDDPCHYATDQIGELRVDLTSELASTASAATGFDLEPQGASLYVHGRPGPGDPAVRQLQRDTASMTADNPYSGVQGQHIVTYQAGAVEQRVLHLQTSDPLRTPTYTMFPVPDYYFSTAGPAGVTIDNAYAFNHGYYSPNIDVTWSSFVGPGVAHHGVDGPSPRRGNQPRDPNSTHTVPQAATSGTWVEETDLRPTLLRLAGLRDDYLSDGHPVLRALRHPSPAELATRRLARVYDQVSSSVGRFATDTLLADTAALASGGPGGDRTFAREQTRLTRLADHRDAWARRVKRLLARPEPARVLTARATVDGRSLLRRASALRASVG